MTKIYFVRHAQPIHEWEEDRSRPLTIVGQEDSRQVTKILAKLCVDFFYSSPYKRSYDTIAESANNCNKKIIIDERFRERKKGFNGNNHGMFQKRWENLDFHEENGESIREVQTRNINALFEILKSHTDKNIVIATHGTALSSILHYFNNDFSCRDFLRIIDYMPYILRLDFDGVNYLNQEEILIVKKEFIGNERVDKPGKF